MARKNGKVQSSVQFSFMFRNFCPFVFCERVRKNHTRSRINSKSICNMTGGFLEIFHHGEKFHFLVA